jgi:outer membrane lipopolysaccharide assembly protein LptE/RlpB
MKRALFVLMSALALLPGCGYSLAGRGSFLPSYIKTIGVPNFANRTTIFNFETQLTQKVRSEFIGRGKYQIVPDQTGVDAVLVGEIIAARVDPTSVSAQGLQTGRSVTVTASVMLRSLHDDSIIWQNAAMTFREEYSAQNTTTGGVTDPNVFFSQDTTALERLSSDFARKIVSDILEAF